jgi:acyl transferase domain-containing protein
LIVPAHREVSIVVVPTSWGGVTYKVSTMDAGQEIVHCQGEGVFRHGAAQSRLDLAQIEVRMQRRRLDPAEIYELFAEAGLEYGPAHRSILAVHVGEKEALARLRLPSSVETSLPDYVLHPSLVDGALQASIGLIADEGAHAVRRYVPFGLESLRVERACTREMNAWIRYADGGTRSDEPLRLDIDLCDQDGNVCVQMTGFTARVLNVEPGAARLTGSDSEIRPSDFEDDFYERIIAAVANGDVSIEEAVELG